MSNRTASLIRFAPSVGVVSLMLATGIGCVASVDSTPPGGSGGNVGGSAPTGSGGSAPGSGGSTGPGGGTGGGTANGTGGGGLIPGGSGGGTGVGGNGTVACSPLVVPSRRLWRLSNHQYSNSVKDLLKVTSVPDITGGGEAVDAFFSKETEQVDSRLEFSYYEAAEAVVGQLDVPKLTACTAGEAEMACAQRLVTNLTKSAFRRPVAGGEITDLMLLYTEGRKKDFATGIRLMVEGVLLAPSFAYRSELGTSATGQTTLTSYEVASQLSYLFLDSIPDPALTTAAAANALNTPAAITAQVDRLLALPQAQANVARFVVDWFGGRGTFGKDSTFPQFTPEFQQDLITANRLFVEDVLWKGTKRLDDLILSNRMFVTPRMAPVFGFTVPAGTAATQFVPVSAPEGQRAGMLTQPGMMAYKATTSDTSIVKRGRFVSDDVLCGPTFPDPPLELINSPDVVAALEKLTTEAQRTEYRMVTNAACKSCHLRMDPYGVLLENLDPIGRYRTKLEDGSPVKATYTLNVSPSVTGSFTGPSQFAQGLVKDKIFSACATRKLASYALGTNLPMSCELAGIHERFEASPDHGVATLLRDIAVASFMRTRGAP